MREVEEEEWLEARAGRPFLSAQACRRKKIRAWARALARSRQAVKLPFFLARNDSLSCRSDPETASAATFTRFPELRAMPLE